MNIYELMFILDPELGKEEQEKLLSRLDMIVKRGEGETFRLDDLGNRQMAYKINKKARGRYFLGYLEGPGSMLSEIEHFLRIDENVLRFILVKQDEKTTRENFLKVVAEEKPAEPVVEEKAVEAVVVEEKPAEAEASVEKTEEEAAE